MHNREYVEDVDQFIEKPSLASLADQAKSMCLKNNKIYDSYDVTVFTDLNGEMSISVEGCSDR